MVRWLVVGIDVYNSAHSANGKFVLPGVVATRIKGPVRYRNDLGFTFVAVVLCDCILRYPTHRLFA